ncbi:MAG: T9SS type A sorting domain-containing protein [Paludibacteraceae bacterium]|nr:T9SS type A sorting domain-containing protein [Paludibacteraceae bacterium]
MRKLFTLSAAMLFATGCFAQYSLSYKANQLRIGDYRNMKQIEYKEQGEAGANQYWDFSKAKILKDMYIDQQEDLNAVAEQGYRLSCDEGGTKHTLFEITKSEKRYYGMITPGAKIDFKEPIVDLMFPLSYQDTKAGIMDGVYTPNNGDPSFIEGNYITKADAWGTLVLPDGNTYRNVLRVKVTKDYKQKFGKTTYNIRSVRYQYFAEGARYPVLIVVESESSTDTGCKCGGKYAEMFMETPAVYENDAVKSAAPGRGDFEYTADFNYLASPNPFVESINLAFTMGADAKVTVDILDMNGRQLSTFMSEQLAAGQYSYTFNASFLTPGQYALRIQVGDKTYTNVMLKGE